MIKKVYTFKVDGIQAVPITVECEVTKGVGVHLVGLADQAVKESLLRTATALQANGYSIPGKKVIINIAPADLMKTGTAYDLPIALAILAASEQEKLPDLENYIIAGELGLDGSVRDIPGWYQAAACANDAGRMCILPAGSASLAARAFQGEGTVYGARTLRDAIDILNGEAPDWTALDDAENSKEFEKEAIKDKRNWWNTIKGHESEKRALEIAAAGGHPILMIGVPGSEKGTLARALRDILPPMDPDEMMDVQRIYSAADRQLTPGIRPFREVSHIVSLPALLGGGHGNTITPGEISLAHAGILHIQDFNSMPKSVAEMLRGPVEDKKIVLSRLKSKIEFPADFFPVFSSLPCPCGWYGEGERCTCTPGQRAAFLARLSGPVADRLTVQIWVHPERPGAQAGEPSETVAARVAAARSIQYARQGKLNDELTGTEAKKVTLSEDPEERRTQVELLEKLTVRLGLSVRAYSRILRLARTIADLAGSESVAPAHLAEASSYRFLDRRMEI